MLTYTPQSERPIASSKEQDKPWLLVLLCLFWVLPGLMGHDPWKPEENEAAALIVDILRSNHWVLPHLADRPYFDTAPLYFWVAAVFANALTWFGVAVHDAARLSTGLWVGAALWGVGLAGRELFGHRYGRLAVVILLGALGLIVWGHHISPAILTLTASAWMVYALALSRRLPLRAGLILGLAYLILLLGATWADALLALLASVSLMFYKAWRKSAYGITLTTALIISLPLAALWGYALHTESSVLFHTWWRNFAWGAYGGASSVATFGDFSFLPQTLPWFTWPVLPLTVWSVWINRDSFRADPRWHLLCTLAGAHLLFVICAGHPTEANVLPLLLVMSVIAVAGVDDLRRGAASALNSFAILTFGLAAILIWSGWLVLLIGQPADLLARLHRYSTAPMQIAPVGLLFALAATVLWGSVLLRRRALGRKALTNWTCGISLILCLFIGLFQNWIDAGKSYRPVADAVQALNVKFQPHCLDATQIPSAPLGALAYFGTYSISTQDVNSCSMAIRPADVTPPVRWTLLAQVQRLGESKEQFNIYLK
ncbi:hypothetical protein NT239_04525 [Chitinibacter sp. SCUT-21]|uniref:ArnT family glycosyltransferase n=1 Tax=Chitinibacter sp. SCUT-21 TaxID=2970891 RepID=UPI0035A65B0D